MKSADLRGRAFIQDMRSLEKKHMATITPHLDLPKRWLPRQIAKLGVLLCRYSKVEIKMVTIDLAKKRKS